MQYLLVSVTGYAALGNNAPASIVLGFDSAPEWVTILANLMVLTHMVSAYQVRTDLYTLLQTDGVLFASWSTSALSVRQCFCCTVVTVLVKGQLPVRFPHSQPPPWGGLVTLQGLKSGMLIPTRMFATSVSCMHCILLLFRCMPSRCSPP